MAPRSRKSRAKNRGRSQSVLCRFARPASPSAEGPCRRIAHRSSTSRTSISGSRTAATGPVPFRNLADAITKRLEDGVDVRMIFPRTRPRRRRRQGQGDAADLAASRLQDGEHVKLMPKTRTKGVIVDSNSVALGSHNWSPLGTLHNRHATLIFHDAPETRSTTRAYSSTIGACSARTSCRPNFSRRWSRARTKKRCRACSASR